MSHHIALARRYRPRRFAEAAAQEHVSETLRRAVVTGRVGHAYLFCGPRGVGKTTLARVLAMSLNCPDRQEDGEPCGTCENCARIWGGTTSLDVIEIDAASNRGVEDARSLRERAMYAPSEEGRFKVYIVDEAHMLTREAWNALLKILEEPPPRVIFVFATTEPQKIEQTAAPILSRCQRFDFRRFGVADIVARLREILDREDMGASEEALRIIGRKADGGMRDGLSILDQVLALSDGEVTPETVRRVLGVVEEERYLHLFGLLAERDRAGLFRLVEELLDQGYDLVEFYYGLVEGLRTLLRLRVGGAGADVPEERRDAWEKRALWFEAADLVRMLGMAAELETGGSLRRNQQPRVLLELLLLRFSYLDRTIELADLIHALGGEPPPALPEPETQGAGASGARGESPPSMGHDPRPERPGREPPPPMRPDPTPEPPGREPPPPMRPDPQPDPPGREEPPPMRPDPDPPPPKSERAGPARPATHSEALRQDRERSGELERAFAALGGEPPGRITVDEARAGRLHDLLEKEPGLRPMVENLDLELLD